jgi:hypothetical protein
MFESDKAQIKVQYTRTNTQDVERRTGKGLGGPEHRTAQKLI